MGGRLTVFALVALACCAIAAAASANADWTTHSRPSDGFALATPASWLDLTSSTPQVLDRAARVPELHALIEVAKGSNLVRFICADPAGFPNVNVVETASRTIGLDEFVAENVATIRQLPFVSRKPSVAPVSLPAGPAEFVSYRETVQGNDVLTEQYYLVHRGRAYIVTYTILPGSAGATASAVSRSAGSFRFLTH